MNEKFFSCSPYELGREAKDELLTSELIALTRYHREHCPEYAAFLDTVNYEESKVKRASDIPFFPVRMFKEFSLLSVDRSEVFKTMTSSGTSGQKVSKIFVDKETALLQQKVMTRILSDFWGKKRLPLLVIDSPSVVRDRTQFSARGAAIIGLNVTAKKTVFALKDDMTLDVEVLDDFLAEYGNEPFIVFGFTFIVWQHLYCELVRLGKTPDMSRAFLMTGGGWKKLIGLNISGDEFKRRMTEAAGITHFLDHYGMVEQTGCIYAECECGHLHASIFSDVFVRDPSDFSFKKNGERGVIQVVSVLPRSYPGHSLLTEDEGVILGEDDCPCGRKGKYIRIDGRIKNAELRGCSDTYGDRYK